MLRVMNERAFARQWACQQLLIRFFHLLDAKRYDELVELFSRTGVWDRPGSALSGHEEIANSLRGRSAHRVSQHIVSNFFVPKEDEAMVYASCTLSTYAVEAPQPGVAPGLVDSFLGLFNVNAVIRMDDDPPCIVHLQLAPSVVFARTL